MYIGVVAPRQVSDILSSIAGNQAITSNNAKIALAKEGMDLYRNPVQFREFEGGGYILTVEKENQTSPRFWLRVVTGRGSVFLTSASAYDPPR